MTASLVLSKLTLLFNKHGQVVSHKLSTVRNADLIAVVNCGSIIETGTHNELLNHEDGHYVKNKCRTRIGLFLLYQEAVLVDQVLQGQVLQFSQNHHCLILLPHHLISLMLLLLYRVFFHLMLLNGNKVLLEATQL